MRVLLLGATGSVGSRLIPALRAHNHEVVLYVRSPNKLPAQARSIASAIESGSGTDSDAIKAAILSNNCNAVINAAGVSKMWSKTGTDFPAIFAAVVKACRDAQHSSGTVLRVWMMSGFGLLDSPRRGYVLMDYIPMFPMHRQNYEVVKPVGMDTVAWSLFCASDMKAQETIDYERRPGNSLVASADVPPLFAKTWQWVPLVGNYLSIMTQATAYYAPLEDCVDFMAADLEKGLGSEFVGKRVGVKVRKQ